MTVTTMPKHENLIGYEMPLGTVVALNGYHDKGYPLWDVKCATCDSVRPLSGSNIKRSTGSCQSCSQKNHLAPVTVNGKRTAEYLAWCGIMERCGIWKGRNAYVEVGIAVCNEWIGPNGYTAFYNHIGTKPSPDLLLDRIDNNGNYEPGNVRWADTSTSNKNKSNANLLTLNGETKNLIEWSKQLNLPFDTIRARLDRGWSDELALLTRVGRDPSNRPDVDSWYLDMCNVVKRRGTCIRREVGCILTDKNGYILSTGYNSVPTGMPHCIDKPCAGAACKSGEGLNLCCASHAEEVALIKCQDIHKIDTCYCTASPCELCIRRLLSTSCKRIVFIEEYPHTKSKELWESVGREWLKYDGEKLVLITSTNNPAL